LPRYLLMVLALEGDSTTTMFIYNLYECSGANPRKRAGLI
jgi:hypothetical protein